MVPAILKILSTLAEVTAEITAFAAAAGAATGACRPGPITDANRPEAEDARPREGAGTVHNAEGAEQHLVASAEWETHTADAEEKAKLARAL